MQQQMQQRNSETLITRAEAETTATIQDLAAAVDGTATAAAAATAEAAAG